MKLFLVLCLSVAGANSVFGQELFNNKSKRTVAGLVQNYGESRPVILYSDGPPAAANTASPAFYRPATVFDQDSPKHVAAQQVLYEYQQTPTNAVSNVHVNQFYQPLTNSPQSQKNNQNVFNDQAHKETVASPVQHSTLVRHGQNFGQVHFQPLGAATPHHIQTQQYVPGKYLYVNGKITYPQPTVQPQLAYYPQNQALYQKPQTFFNPQQPVLNQRLQAPVAHQLPVNFKQFHPPQRHEIQKITKPMGVIPVEEVPVEDEEAEDVDEESAPVEEDNDEDAGYENDEESDDEEGDRYFGRYSFDEEEDNDHYVEDGDDEEEDSDGGSTREVPSKSYHKSNKRQNKKSNKPQKYNDGKNYKFSESFSTSSKYNSSPKNKNYRNKKSKGNNKKAAPKMQYKSMKYSRQIGKPRRERIEGNPSENVPVVHKQRILKEKWYLTKSSEETR